MVSNNKVTEFEGSRRFLNIDDLDSEDGNYLLEDAYVIRQDLSYEERVAADCDLVNEIEQLVILDGDLQVRVLMVSPQYRTIPLCF
jgi:hypothetical protein